jgi:hypothetical protein
VDADTSEIDALEAAPQTIAEAVGRRLSGGVEELYEGARSIWPVRTGVSRHGIQWGLSGPAEAILAFVENRVPYAGFVRQAGALQTVWQETVIGPAQALEEAMLADLTDELEAILYGEEDV